MAASQRRNLSSAAVSRTLCLLENALGAQLFNRVGRSLALNSQGRSLRDAVRTATAAVDLGLGEMLTDSFTGELTVSSLGVLTEYFVVPTVVDLMREHPGLIPEHLNRRTAEAITKPWRGEIDVAFYYDELGVEGALVEQIDSTPMTVYCGASHPLFSLKHITSAMVLKYPFSIPQLGDTGRSMDGWPTDIRRNVSIRVTMLATNLAICLSGATIAALEGVRAGTLRRLPTRPLPRIKIFAARPTTGLEVGAASLLVQRAKSYIKAYNRRLR